SPQVAATMKLIATFARVLEEAAVDRLDYVFGIDTAAQFVGQTAPCQGDQSVCIAPEQLVCRLLIAVAPPGHQIAGSIVHALVHLNNSSGQCGLLTSRFRNPSQNAILPETLARSNHEHCKQQGNLAERFALWLVVMNRHAIDRNGVDFEGDFLGLDLDLL